MRKLKNILFYAGLTEEEYRRIQPEIIRSNQRSLQTYTKVAAFFLMIMFAFSLLSPRVRSKMWIYLIPLLIVLALKAAASHGKEQKGITVACVYGFVAVLYLFGIVLGTVAEPEQLTVTFVALLLTVPLLFLDRPVRMICSIFFFAALFVTAAVLTKDPSVLFTDLVNVCVFATISAIISTYMMEIKCQRYLYEKEALILSRMDLLTGLHNRNSFEQKLDRYPSRCRKSLGCVYADVNGLHELNNTKGHKAGDQMLQYIADGMKETFGMEDTFRIGGDEFVAFALDEDTATIQRKLEKMQERIERNGYHVSFGVDLQEISELDMDVLIKQAERKMYEEKKKYYQKRGQEERRRSGK